MKTSNWDVMKFELGGRNITLKNENEKVTQNVSFKYSRRKTFRLSTQVHVDHTMAFRLHIVSVVKKLNQFKQQ